MATASIVLVTGLQGTGKSTVAEGVARRLGAPSIAWDWTMAALTPFDAVQATLRGLDAVTYRSLGWALMFQCARQQLRMGLPVVLDGLAREGEIRRVRDLSGECGVDSLVVLTRCDDEEIQRGRIEQRSRGIPGWHELRWEDVARTRRAWVEPADVDLVLDSTRPVDELVAEVVARIPEPM